MLLAGWQRIVCKSQRLCNESLATDTSMDVVDNLDVRHWIVWCDIVSFCGGQLCKKESSQCERHRRTRC